ESPAPVMPGSIPRPAERGEGGRRPGEGSATSRTPSAAAPARAGTVTPSKPASESHAAATAPIAPAGATTNRRQETTSRAIDAALEDLTAEREGDGRSVRWGMGFWGELAKAEHP